MLEIELGLNRWAVVLAASIIVLGVAAALRWRAQMRYRGHAFEARSADRSRSLCSALGALAEHTAVRLEWHDVDVAAPVPSRVRYAVRFDDPSGWRSVVWLDAHELAPLMGPWICHAGETALPATVAAQVRRAIAEAR